MTNPGGQLPVRADNAIYRLAHALERGHPQDDAARAIVERDPDNNAILHTNCVATMLEAGHARRSAPTSTVVSFRARR